ncbi:MAG TPA: hypothetical protein VG433_11965, partial [Pirellulales bacterium]|nr:hypothetical protein [Pirellulales bacterium]
MFEDNELAEHAPSEIAGKPNPALLNPGQAVAGAPPVPGREASAPPTAETRDIRSVLDEQLYRLFQANSPWAYRLAMLGLLAGALTVTALQCWTGCAPIWKMPYDSLLMLDGGWRVICGQRPHLDFYSPLGAVPYLITALGMRLAGPTADALAVGPAVLMPLLVGWCWWVVRRRMSAVHGLLIATWIGLLAVAPFTLGDRYNQCSYAMQYNRYGWALISLLLIESFVAPLPGSRGRFRDGLSTGALLGLLAFTKFTYFGLALIAVALALFKQGRHLRRLAGILAGFLLIALGMAAFLRFDLQAYLADLELLSRGHPISDELRWVIPEGIANAATGLTLLVFVLLTWDPAPGGRFSLASGG